MFLFSVYLLRTVCFGFLSFCSIRNNIFKFHSVVEKLLTLAYFYKVQSGNY